MIRAFWTRAAEAANATIGLYQRSLVILVSIRTYAGGTVVDGEALRLIPREAGRAAAKKIAFNVTGSHLAARRAAIFSQTSQLANMARRAVTNASG